MESLLMKVFIFLLITVGGTGSSTLSINVMKNASVTLPCLSYHTLKKCDCTSLHQDCICTNPPRARHQFKYYDLNKYNTLSGLQLSDSGLYACIYRSSYGYDKKYRLNVIEVPESTLVIRAVGESVVMSCGTEPDTKASEKQWCRSSNGTVCQPDTIMSREHEPKGNFTILEDHSLEISQLTSDDIGFYRCTQHIRNQIKVHLVELQVKDKPNFLRILPVQLQQRTEEPFKLLCQYSQDLKEHFKSWLCDSAKCPETVRMVDDRFQSALVLTIDQDQTCSNIRHFECVAEKPGHPRSSDVYSRLLNPNSYMDFELRQFGEKMTTLKVKAYTELHLSCLKKRNRHRYDYHDSYNRLPHTYESPDWCKVSGRECVKLKTEEGWDSVKLQLCVTPKDNGTIYRCKFISLVDTKEVKIIVFEPTPEPAPPPWKPPTIVTIPSKPGVSPVGGIMIISTVIFLIIIGIAVIRYKDLGKKLTECWAARTPLQSDVYADMYANSVAHYYRRQTHPLEKQAEDDKETSSDSDDEFEQLPDRARHKEEEETEYIRVKPGMLRKDEPAAPPDKVVMESEGAAKGTSDNEDDEDDVTYTHVTILPKRPPK